MILILKSLWYLKENEKDKYNFWYNGRCMDGKKKNKSKNNRNMFIKNIWFLLKIIPELTRTLLKPMCSWS